MNGRTSTRCHNHFILRASWRARSGKLLEVVSLKRKGIESKDPFRQLEPFDHFFIRGLIMIWNKSLGYWKDITGAITIVFHSLKITWVGDIEVSKFLGAPFELFLDSKFIDEFQYDRIF